MAEANLTSKKKEFQDEVVRDFWASEKYVSEQAEYRVRAYIDCLGVVEKALRKKG